jgi:methionyl-tRNA formyltransferase
MQPGAGGLDDLERQLRVLEARKHPARKFSNVKERIGAVTAIGGRGLLVSAQGGQSEVLTLRSRTARNSVQRNFAAQSGLTAGTFPGA